MFSVCHRVPRLFSSRSIPNIADFSVLKWHPWSKDFILGINEIHKPRLVRGRTLIDFLYKILKLAGRERENRILPQYCYLLAVFFSFSLCIDGGWLLSLKAENQLLWNSTEIARNFRTRDPFRPTVIIEFFQCYIQTWKRRISSYTVVHSLRILSKSTQREDYLLLRRLSST